MGRNDWWKEEMGRVPEIRTKVPGPKSEEQHGRCTKYFVGLSSQVSLCPVVFESGKGCTLTDVDGNRYIGLFIGDICDGAGALSSEDIGGGGALGEQADELPRFHDAGEDAAGGKAA